MSGTGRVALKLMSRLSFVAPPKLAGTKGFRRASTRHAAVPRFPHPGRRLIAPASSFLGVAVSRSMDSAR
jgi:hypothetical protein